MTTTDNQMTELINAVLKDKRITLRWRDEECRVNYKGGREETAYYTTDRDDAFKTASKMLEDLK